MRRVFGLMLGYRCNARCRHCFVAEALDDRTAMSAADACDYIDQAVELGDVDEVGFAGGEPFLFRRVMKEAMLHAWEFGGLPSFISTNSYWAVSLPRARVILADLYDRGLRTLQISVDEYHQEFVPIERPANVVKAAVELGIKCCVQRCVTKRGHPKEYYVEKLGIDEARGVTLQTTLVMPTGFARRHIPRSEFRCQPGVPSDWCSILRNLNVMPDGKLTVCCGSFMGNSELCAGDLKRERLTDIVARAERDPLYLALAEGTGPRILAEKVREAGRGGELREGYVGSCDACQDILCRLKAGPEIRARLTAAEALVESS